MLENFFILKMSPLLATLLVSLLITILITIVYKFATNQKQMKILKDDQKRLQKEMKDAKNNPKKLMDIQKIAMQKNLEYMKHSFKSTIYTIIPIFIIFGWMNSHMAFYGIAPNQPFNTTVSFQQDATGAIELKIPENLTLESNAVQNVTPQVTWQLKGPAGEYTLEYDYLGESYTKDIIITNDWTYKDPALTKSQNFLGLKSSKQSINKESKIESIKIDLKPVKPFGSLSLLGWHPGWLGTYIISSLIFSMILRKLLKVY